MRRPRLLLLCASVALALALGGAWLAPARGRASTPAPATEAILHRIVWGIDDQNIALFADPRWNALPLKHVRYFLPWDLRREPRYLHRADRWLTIAGRSHTVPLIAITQSDIHGRTRQLPSLKLYRRDVHWIMHRFWWIHEWTPWNEANLHNQATYHHPARAAQYWRVMRRLCRKCTVTSPSLVGYHDRNNHWMHAFVRAAHGLRGPWAIHIYNDVNQFNTLAITQLERQLPSGPIWVTEVGGFLRFVGYCPSLSRQKRAVGFIFELAARAWPRVKRWYLYQWFASSPRDRWDSGLVNSNGTPRPALSVVQDQLGAAAQALAAASTAPIPPAAPTVAAAARASGPVRSARSSSTSPSPEKRHGLHPAATSARAVCRRAGPLRAGLRQRHQGRRRGAYRRARVR